MEKEFNLEQLAAKDIAADPHTEKQFITLLTQLHGVSAEQAAGIYARELSYFERAFNEPKSRIPLSTNLSLFSAFIEIAISNVSIQPGAKSDAYITTRSANYPTRQGNVSTDHWVTTCMLTLTAYGELSLRIRAGQLKGMSNPIVVYKGDVFQPCTNDLGDLIIQYVPKMPRESKTIIACWVALFLPHGIKDYKWMVMEDIERLQEASGKQVRDTTKTNKEKSNALYRSGRDDESKPQIDVGFLETKCMKHAMKALPKLRIGSSIITETDIDYEAVVEAAPSPSFAQSTGTPVEKAQTDEVIITNTEEGF